MSYFYSHIINIESLITSLDELDLTSPQKRHLSELIDSTIHHVVLDVILSKLSDEDKKIFIVRLKKDPDDKQLMEFLNSKLASLEKDIDRAVNELKTELHKDIVNSKKQNLIDLKE